MNKTLVIMAAGLGSRFGGLKQIEPVGPNGEFLIDYCVYDAYKAGFTRVVFIIKKENYEVFKETIGERIRGKMQVDYVFQEMDDIPLPILSKTRVKPWGTAHAIYCARDKIHEPFCIINADDFYGREAYQDAFTFLEENKDSPIYGLIGYPISQTLSQNGALKRGICKTSNGYLTEIIESEVLKSNDKIIATPLSGGNSYEVMEDELVSLNMMILYPNIFPFLEEKLKAFLKLSPKELETKEFLIPDVLEQAILEGFCKVKVKETKAIWHGMTYKQDKEEVVRAIKKQIKEEIYPSCLWNIKKEDVI